MQFLVTGQCARGAVYRRRVTKPSAALRLETGLFSWGKSTKSGESFMKLVTAIIKPFKLDDVRESL